MRSFGQSNTWSFMLTLAAGSLGRALVQIWHDSKPQGRPGLPICGATSLPNQWMFLSKYTLICWRLSHGNYFLPHIWIIIPQNKNVRQLVGLWHLHVDTVVEGSELYCYNTEGDRNSVVNQASCRMDVTRLEHDMSKFKHGEASGIRLLPLLRQRNLNTLWDYFEGLWVRTCTVFIQLLVRVIISDKL